MKTNDVQFAVVREDPQIELSVIRELRRELGTKHALLIGSGGCTAFSLQAAVPNVEITIVDGNPAQIRLIQEKARALSADPSAGKERLFNIGNWGGGDPAGLNACGNFESLFRGFSTFIQEMICSRDELEQLITTGPEKLFSHKYWPVAFDLFFSESLLNTMFGPDATQYAPRGTYPGYFRGVIEKALSRADAADNYFLHHIFLGHYLKRKKALPLYLQGLGQNLETREAKLNYLTMPMDQVSDIGEYDLISLSNIFDWMAPAKTAELLGRLDRETKPDCAVIIRQLNNVRDLKSLLPSFHFDEAREAALLAADRSMFYCKLNIGTKRGMK